MQAIADVIPILPVAIVSAVFLEKMDTSMNIMEVETYSNRLIKQLQKEGAPIFEVPRSTQTHAIAEAVDIMLLRRMIRATGDRLNPIPAEKNLLAYYANAITHWLKV